MSKQPHEEAAKIVPLAAHRRMVLIKLIRRPEFLQKEFNLKRADEMAANFDLEKLGHPILNHRDDVFLTIDGCHRIYGLVKNGFEDYELDCDVYENLTDVEMAKVFLGHARRRVMSPFERFNVHCSAQDAREVEIRRIVETNGLKISRLCEMNCISAVSALGRVYDRASAAVLGQVLRTIRDAFGGDSLAFDGQIISGLGLVFNRYNGRAEEKRLTQCLVQMRHGARGLLLQAERKVEKTGNDKAQCLAAAVVDIYNKDLTPKNRLSLWWKEA